MRVLCLRFVQRCSLCLCAVFLFPFGSAAGEKFPLATVVPHSVPEPLRPKLGTLVRQHADMLYHYLLLRTDEADRVCGLSDADLSTLRLAAKGTVQQVLDDWLASIAAVYAADPQGTAAQQLTMWIGGRLTEQPIVVQVRGGRDGLKDFQITPRTQLIQKDGKVLINTGGITLEERRGAAKKPAQSSPASSLSLDRTDTADTGIWRATLDRVLSEEQQAKLSALYTAREKRSKQLQLERMLTFLDEELLLDYRQHERITQLCSRFLSERSSSLDSAGLAQIAMNSLSAEELSGLLSKRQQSRWHEIRKKDRPNVIRPNVVWHVTWEADVPVPRLRGF